MPLTLPAVLMALCLPIAAQPPAAGISTQVRSRDMAEPPSPFARGDGGEGISSARLRELGDTVALLPWCYRSGKEAALQFARAECNQLLLETGFNVFLTKSPTGAMPPPMPGTGVRKTSAQFEQLLRDGRALIGQTVTNQSDAPYTLPTVDQMIAIGDRLQTRYVLAGRAQWSTRNVWIGISNRVKSMCTVDVLVLDMSTRQLVLDARNVVADSTEQKNIYNTVTSVLSLNPLPLVLPGSVTPQEQTAVAVATARALEPWLKAQRILAALTQADESSELSEKPAPEEKFTTLVRPIGALHATLKFSDVDEKQVASLNADFARILTWHELALSYTKPNRLTLTATTPAQVKVTLLASEEMQRYSAGDNDKVAVQDLSVAPDRRLTLLDLCGVLTPEMFNFMRARFVRRETVDHVDAVVYDLTFWRGAGGAYQRAWIDPGRRILVKRSTYDRSGKLKATSTYRKPAEVAPGVWLPTRVEVTNPAAKTILALEVADVRIDQEENAR